MEKNLSCGEISNLDAWQIWRNLKFLPMLSNFKFLHMTDVETFEVSPHLACVWCGECLNICTRYAVLFKNWFCRDIRRFVAKSFLSRFMHFWVEKNWTKDYVCGEKVTNIRYADTMMRCLRFIWCLGLNVFAGYDDGLCAHAVWFKMQIADHWYHNVSWYIMGKVRQEKYKWLLILIAKTSSQMDVAPWYYKWMWLD